MDDYYLILGVSPSATSDDIKSAYRKLAHVYHPDKPTGDEKRFKKIGEAYHHLGDAQRRANYDHRMAAMEASKDNSEAVTNSNTSRAEPTQTQEPQGSDEKRPQENVPGESLWWRRTKERAHNVFWWWMQCGVGILITIISTLVLVGVSLILQFVVWARWDSSYKLADTWQGLALFSAWTLLWLFKTEWLLKVRPYKNVRIVAGVILLLLVLFENRNIVWQALSDAGM